MNLIEKVHALLVSDEVNIWHFQGAKPPVFVYWLACKPDDKEGRRFASMEEMIGEAYSHIDPLLKTLPETLRPPAAAANH